MNSISSLVLTICNNILQAKYYILYNNFEILKINIFFKIDLYITISYNVNIVKIFKEVSQK